MLALVSIGTALCAAATSSVRAVKLSMKLVTIGRPLAARRQSRRADAERASSSATSASSSSTPNSEFLQKVI